MLQLDKVSIRYESKTVVQQVSWHLESGEIGCLLGNSGSGKTSILKAIAGFKSISEGRVVIRQNTVSSAQQLLAPEKRKVGMMFQDLALFPHLNVAQNITFGLQKQDKARQRQRMHELLELVGLHGRENDMIHQLSGGQQQRVALARALAPRPDLLLLDEPFSSLDKDLREHLGQQVRNILKQENTTALLVTHDHAEAFTMADQIAVLSHGQLKQTGSPYQVYHQPNSQEIADFLGVADYLPVKLVDEALITPIAEFSKSSLSNRWQKGDKAQLLVRPDDVIHDDQSQLQAKVIRRYFKGAQFLFELDCQGYRLHCYASAHHNHLPGDVVGIRFDMQHCILFPEA
ncbi:ABC transporter ATP-binding protein [Planctobacterium marinum]|uniref:ABC transporter ATP-binding protein n=1 Tax=Planctobacterium marinum TaxID=1631968 RepID=A0AA48HUS2_9ALTE|nr:ABC transporter ATP-binding protein [Planctobacterium marinum]